MEKECCKVGVKFWMPRIEKNGDVGPIHGRKVSNPLIKRIHLSQLNNDDVDIDDDDDDDDNDDDVLIREVEYTNFLVITVLVRFF